MVAFVQAGCCRLAKSALICMLTVGHGLDVDRYPASDKPQSLLDCRVCIHVITRI